MVSFPPPRVALWARAKALYSLLDISHEYIITLGWLTNTTLRLGYPIDTSGSISIGSGTPSSAFEILFSTTARRVLMPSTNAWSACSWAIIAEFETSLSAETFTRASSVRRLVTPEERDWVICVIFLALAAAALVAGVVGVVEDMAVWMFVESGESGVMGCTKRVRLGL